MDIKWKNNLVTLLWLVVFTFGLSGVFPYLVSGYYYRMAFAFYLYTAVAAAILAVTLVYIKKTPIFRSGLVNHLQNRYNRIPLDVGAVVFLIFLFITLRYVSDLNSDFISGSVYYFINHLLIGTLLVVVMLAQIQWIRNRLREKDSLSKEWEGSLLYQVWQGINNFFFNLGVGIKTLAVLVIFAASGFGLPFVIQFPGAIMLYAPLFLIFTLPAIILTARKVGAFNRILAHASSLSRGNIEADLKVKGHSEMAQLAENINVLKHGVETSQVEQAKSERMKTELITNVSHDLRTPLTSIITYTELLKKPELAEDERNSYVEIIDRKSKRLKVLIEDLFEASKMASGSINLVKEKVDLTQLLEQALAENDERIKESSLQFRVTKPDQPVYCVVDGQKIWRVFDNLIGNILKYAMDHTRVYLVLENIENQVRIVFKNISEYDLNDSADDLFERFKRGDESRHTEGSGLGLAIAKSIIDLHEGSMDIEVDGDLFKVTVLLKAAA